MIKKKITEKDGKREEEEENFEEKLEQLKH